MDIDGIKVFEHVAVQLILLREKEEEATRELTIIYNKTRNGEFNKDCCELCSNKDFMQIIVDSLPFSFPIKYCPYCSKQINECLKKEV